MSYIFPNVYVVINMSKKTFYGAIKIFQDTYLDQKGKYIKKYTEDFMCNGMR